MDIRSTRISKPFNRNPLKRHVVRGIRIKNTIDEHQLQPVYTVIKRRFVRCVKYACTLGYRFGQCAWVCVFPILIAFGRQTHCTEPRQGVITRRGKPCTALWHRLRGKARISQVCFNVRQSHLRPPLQPRCRRSRFAQLQAPALGHLSSQFDRLP